MPLALIPVLKYVTIGGLGVGAFLGASDIASKVVKVSVFVGGSYLVYKMVVTYGSTSNT